MPVVGLDPERCRRRNRLAARRGEVSVPVRFSAAEPASVEARLVRATGTLPETEAAAVRAINARTGLEGDAALKVEDLWLLYPEVANTNYIGDRSMFLHTSTLKNIRRDAVAGFAFMNSHRTGSISTESELPYGTTFAGRYEVWETAEGARFARTVIGAYMRRGLKPNGDGGPTTDDLYEGIRSGTIFDVSVGLREGEFLCDVCGHGLDDDDPETGRALCPHVPGTTRKMTDQEIQDQSARGVPDGVASFSLVDAIPGEFSAVYDGAVPGAGFRKAAALLDDAAAGRARLRRADAVRLARLYGPFLGDKRLGVLAAWTGDARGGRTMARGNLFGFGRGRARIVDSGGRLLGQLESDQDDDGDDSNAVDHDDLRAARTRRQAAGEAPPARDNAGPGGREPAGAGPTPPPDPAVVQLRSELQEVRALLQQQTTLARREAEDRRRDQLAKLRADADRFAANLIRPANHDYRTHGQRILPSQAKPLADLYFNAAVDDAESPMPDGEPTRLSAVQKFAAELATRDRTGEHVTGQPVHDARRGGGRELKNGSEDGDGSAGDPLGETAGQIVERTRRNAQKWNRQGGSGGNGAAAQVN